MQSNNASELAKPIINNQSTIVEYSKNKTVAESTEELKNYDGNKNKITTEPLITKEKNITSDEETSIVEEPKPKIPVSTIDKNNWHLALSYSGIEGNGLQVLLNSLAEYKDNELVIRYLPKVEHFLTESLNASMIQYLQDYFDQADLTIRLTPKEELNKTPKDRKIKRHEEDVKLFCEELMENPCVATLQKELGAVIDKQTIKVKSNDF